MGGKKCQVRAIKDHLFTLGLEERRPSFHEVREAFKVKVLEQPDSADEAVREVLSWLSEQPPTATMEEEEGDKELLKVFESSSSVTYHQGSVTFHLEEEKVEEWLSSLREYFKDEETKEKEGDHSVQFKHPMWPLEGQEGTRVVDTLSVILYPSCSEPKVLVQGKLYMQFVTQVLPRMAMSLGKDKAKVKAILGGEGVKETEDKQKGDGNDLNTVNDSIKRLEKAFMEKMEVSVKYQMATQGELKEVKSEMQALKKEMENFKESTPVVAQPQGFGSVQSLTTKIENSTKEINSKIEEVKVSVKKVEEITQETSKDVKKIISGSEEVMKQFAKLHSELDTINQSLVRSRLLVGTSQPQSSPTLVVAEVATQEEEVVEVAEVKQRKGILFTSSIGKYIDMAKLEKETNSKVEKVMTYRIEEKKDSPDPEAFVENMVKEKLKEDHDFAVFLVGSNDISEMKGADLDSTDVLAKCERQSQHLLDTLVDIATKNSTEVFVSEMTPRYDSSERDETGPLAVLSSYANSTMVTKVMEARARSVRLHLINQRNLVRPKGVEQNKIYQRDGRHLTKEGVSLLTCNITKSLRSVYKDMPKVEVEGVKEEVKVKEAPKVKTPLKVKGGLVHQDPRHLPKNTPPPPPGANRPPGGQFQPWVGQSLPPRPLPRHLLPPREQVAPPHHWGPREPQYPAPLHQWAPREPQYAPAPAPRAPDYPYYGPPPPAGRPGHPYTMGPQYTPYDAGFY